MTFSIEKELAAMTTARHKMQVERDSLILLIQNTVVPELAKCGAINALEILYIAMQRIKDKGEL